MLENLRPFFDELEKISAQKCRSGSVPIRAHNLAKKESYDGREKTRTKLSGIQLAKDIAQEASKGGKFLSPTRLKAMGLLGLGGAGAITGEQAIEDWSLGRQIRKQQG